MKLVGPFICLSLALAITSCGSKGSNEQNADEQGIVTYDAEEYGSLQLSSSCDYSPEGSSDLYEGVFKEGFDLASYNILEETTKRCQKIAANMMLKQKRYEKRFNKLSSCKGDRDTILARNEATRARGFKALRRALREKITVLFQHKLLITVKLLQKTIS